MSRKKLTLIILILLLALTAVVSLTPKSNIQKSKERAIIEKITNCSKNQNTDFLICIDPYIPILLQEIPVDKVEQYWVEKTDKYNWPKCHEALHVVGKYLPDLTPTQLRDASGRSFSTFAGKCALGLMMGYAERNLNDLTEKKVLDFNNFYCLPELNNGMDYSEQCSHITGHLTYNYEEKDTTKALNLCEKIKHHPELCAEGVYMQHFAHLEETSPQALTVKQALERCRSFDLHLNRCLPFASHAAPAETVEDITNHSTICLTLLPSAPERNLTCANLLSQSFQRSPLSTLMKVGNICNTFPDRDKCTSALLRALTLKTGDIESINKICRTNLKNTNPCKERFDHYYQVPNRR